MIEAGLFTLYFCHAEPIPADRRGPRIEAGCYSGSSFGVGVPLPVCEELRSALQRDARPGTTFHCKAAT
jgi:hypothetical protein